MIYLPKHIWQKIFEYDSTYHEKYNNVLKQFHELTPFWKLNWINFFTETKFICKKSQIYYIEKFWDKCPDKLYLCYSEFITDDSKIELLKLMKS